MSLWARLKGVGPSGFGYGSTAEEVTAGLSLAGKTMLVTGCNSGLGFETARVLALRGARVLGTARSEAKAKAALDRVEGVTLPLACELAEPASVQACVEKVRGLGHELDALVCNAGVMMLPKLETSHGYDLQFFTNHVGHFLLVTGLLESLSAAGRVVMLSSAAHMGAPKGGIDFDNLDGSRGYGSVKMYGQSKMANLLFAKQLARRLAGSKRTANAVHPGVIKTNLARHLNPVLRGGMALIEPLFLKSVEQGAATQVYVATHPALDGVSGEYFADVNVAKPRADANDPALAQRLWEVSETIAAQVGLGAGRGSGNS